MRKNFTKLVCIGIACFCMVSAMAQENKPVVSTVKGMDFTENNVNLRADETEYWWPDSIVTYNSAGEPTYKSCYDKENRTVISANRDNGSWKFDDPESSDGFFFVGGFTPYVGLDVRSNEFNFSLAGLNYNTWWTFQIDYYEYNTVYDNKGNPVLVEIRTSNDGADIYMEYRITYNERNNPVLVEVYWYKDLIKQFHYEYNEKGHLILWYSIDVETKLSVINNNCFKVAAKFDEIGKPVEWQRFTGNASFNDWLLNSYWLFYYSDGTTSNEQIASTASTAYLFDRTLYIQSKKADRITVYSIVGQQLYETVIQPGMNTVNAANLPQGILIVRGSSGWVSKVVNRN